MLLADTMFGKGGFEGQIRRTPNQSIRGASKSESKDELVKRAQEERVGREARRREHSSALVIQAAVRGHLARGRHSEQVGEEIILPDTTYLIILLDIP